MIARVDAALGLRPTGRSLALGRWTVACLLALLLLLAIAETRWLRVAIPRDSVSRVALVAFPAATMSDDADWQRRFLATARKAAATEGSSRIAGTCIDWTNSSGRRVRGLLLVNTVRGSEPVDVDGIAREWAGRVGRIGPSTSPALSVIAVESLGFPYEVCR